MGSILLPSSLDAPKRFRQRLDMLAVVSSGTLQGIEAVPVQVEVNTGEQGEPRLVLVGLPDAAVRESVNRVSSALMNSGFAMPKTKTTVNLAPGDLRKMGPAFDLPIALGILAATGVFPPNELDGMLFAGELALSGEIRPIAGGLSFAMMAKAAEKTALVVPPRTADEAALVDDLPILAVHTLEHAVDFLRGRALIARTASPLSNLRDAADEPHPDAADFAEVKGQHSVRRAIEVAVAGAHNVLMIGSPGSGKSMIAKRIPTIMTPPTRDELLDMLRIHSAAGMTLEGDLRDFRRPFRSPHHTISTAGLVGGGSNVPTPGEISFAHHGVLFLDELPEFNRQALEVLRQPMEDGEVTLSRSRARLTLPSGFMLVAAMNPCPCGYLGDARRECRCSPREIERYRARISGPLLDRIDIHVEAPAVSLSEMRSQSSGESSATMRERVTNARERQTQRFAGGDYAVNARMPHAAIRRHCELTPELGQLLQQAMEQLALSARAYDRILKVSRTIADLAGAEDIAANHLLEAIQYRTLDRTTFV